MLTFLIRSLDVWLLIGLVILTGCAGTSEKSTVMDQHPLDPGIPLSAYLQGSQQRESLPVISAEEKNQGSRAVTHCAPQNSQPNLIKATDGIPPISELEATSIEDCNVVVKDEVAFCEEPASEKPAADTCLPLLNQWKSEYELQTQQTDEKIRTLEKTLQVNHEKLLQMEAEQVLSKSEISRLQTQLVYYQKEVTRLEQLMHTQHSADLVILDSLSLQLGGLLEKAKNDSN